MFKFQHLVLASILAGPGCSGSNNESNDLTLVPVLEISATHAIALEQPATNVSFVPNNVAPWLGRLILNNQDKGLSSTDIEGRKAQIVSDQLHTYTIGLARENASGVFLVIDQNLKAFVETDDQGNFMPLSSSGTTLAPNSFCETDTQQESTTHILTNESQITTLSLAIEQDETAKNAPIEQNITASLPAPKNSTICAISDDIIFAYSNSGDQGQLQSYTDGNWKNAFISSSVSHMVPVTLNETVYLLLLDNEEVFLFNTSSQKIENRLVITSGLSIAGLEKTKFIGSTTHNFGGAAFSAGLVAFGQADENRIVFVSRLYLEDLLKQEKT